MEHNVEKLIIFHILNVIFSIKSLYLERDFFLCNCNSVFSLYLLYSNEGVQLWKFIVSSMWGSCKSDVHLKVQLTCPKSGVVLMVQLSISVSCSSCAAGYESFCQALFRSQKNDIFIHLLYLPYVPILLVSKFVLFINFSKILEA